MNKASFSYPLNEMHTTASTQRQLLEETWQSHQHQMSNTILYTASLLLTDAGAPFEQHITIWNQQLQKHYQALLSLADQLDQGATTMDAQDTTVAHTFQTGPSK